MRKRITYIWAKISAKRISSIGFICRLHKVAYCLPQFGLSTVVGNLYQEDTCSRWASDLFDSNSKSLYNLLLLGKNYLLSRAVASATQRRTRNLG